MFDIQSPTNYEQKCLCVLLLDTSGSMQGSKIRSLQKGIEIFKDEIEQDPTTSNRLEVAIVTFDYTVDVLQAPSLIGNITMPELTADGSTSMGEAIDKAIDIIEARKAWYKKTGQPYYRPWIILMTDGQPTDIPDIQAKGAQIKGHVNNKNFYFFAVGVEGANMQSLIDLSSEKMLPAKLEGLKFSEFFKWLSASMTIVVNSQESEKVDFPAPTDWTKGFTIS